MNAKGRVERQVRIVREGVLVGRVFASLDEMNAAFQDWLPWRRSQVHRTHGQVIAVRSEVDRAALGALPSSDYVVTERHLRSVGKDCLVSFEASLYSLPWREVRRPMRVELRVTSDIVAIHRVGGPGELLATHARATSRGAWVVDETHWAGLPDGGRTASLTPVEVTAPNHEDATFLASRSLNAGVIVHHRDLAFYDRVGAA